MIPEYRTIHSLIHLKNNHILRKNLKKKILTWNYQKKRFFYRLTFNPITNNRVFNHVISLISHFEKLDLTEHFGLINDFNLLLAALLPVFNFQVAKYQHYDDFSLLILDETKKNPVIEQWSQAALVLPMPELEPLTKNKNVPEQIINKIKILTHCSGQLFATLLKSKNQENNYQLGYFLMLFYLLQLETKQTLKNNDTTTWNLKLFVNYYDLFNYKLAIIEKLNTSFMNFAQNNFNLYWRVINYTLNDSFDS